MKIEFDPVKDGRNQDKHGIGLERAIDFEWETALFMPDRRQDYGEDRIIATGWLDERLHVLCYTRRQDMIRIISLRKANQREVRNYGQDETN